jgi:K+-transporting ATPase KdpF subunit
MSWVDVALLILTIPLAGYLVAALLFPEKF